MNILILSDLFKMGGLENNIKSYMEKMTENHEFYLVASDIEPNVIKQSIFNRVKQINLTGQDVAISLKDLAKFCIDNKIDRIHAHSTNAYVFGSIVGQQLRIPYILTAHGPATLEQISSPVQQDIVTNIILKEAELIYTVSEEVKGLIGAFSENVKILPNYVDTDKYMYKDRSYYAKDNRWALVSRLDLDKIYGIKEALSSLYLYNIKEIDVFGDGNGSKELKEFILENQLEIKINFKGTSDQLEKDLEGYTGVIGMGRVILEAAAMGYPTLLIGYDGIKGILNKEKFLMSSTYNFSGRNLPVLEEEQMKFDATSFFNHYEQYILVDLIREQYSLQKGLEVYIQDLEEIQHTDKKEILDLIELIGTSPIHEDIYNSSRFLSLYYNKFKDEHREILLYKLIEQNNTAYQKIVELQREKDKVEEKFNSLNKENKGILELNKQQEKQISSIAKEIDKIKLDLKEQEEKNEIICIENKSLQEENEQLLNQTRELVAYEKINVKDKKIKELNDMLYSALVEKQQLNDMLYNTLIEKEYLNKNLWNIHSSTFWKVATKYYRLRDNTFLGYPYKAMKKIRGKNKAQFTTQLPEVSTNHVVNYSMPSVVEHPKRKSVYIFGGVAYYDIGGGQRSAQLAKTFYKLGYDVYYVFAYDSSEKTKVEIDLPVKAHIHIDQLTEQYVKENIDSETFFVFEIPHNKFNKYLDLANLFGVKTVYEHIDNWETSLGGDWFDLEVYRNFLNKSDMLVATAILLKEKLEETIQKYCDQKDKKVHYLANAVDSELFEALIERECPKDLAKGEKTLIYYGSLWGEWFNWDLIFGVAKRFPKYTINLIGEAEGIKERFDNIPKNVHFLGLKKQLELPGYLKHSDIAILPFTNCDIGKYVSPLKIFEYICMNKVVLSTKLTDIGNYPNVYYGDTPEEWIEILEQNPEVKDSIVGFINQNNWYDRCYKMIEELGKDRKVDKKISVIVLNRNNKKVIFRCVDSLLANNKYNYQVIVVDNQSDDGSCEMLEKQYGDQITLIKNSKNGCACGRNLGVSHATGEMLVFMDSDQWALSNDWLDNALDILEKERSIGGVGWAAGWFSPGSVGGPICDYLPNRGVGKNELYRTDIAYLGTGGLVISKSIYDQIGGFDENLDPTCYEDTDFTLGIKHLGFNLAYSPYLPIFHLPHQTTKSGSSSHAKLMEKNGDYFKEKWKKLDASLLEVYLNE